ncbi:MAG: hypothetical protein WC955_01160 [Elusimicrobiota bacterium]
MQKIPFSVTKKFAKELSVVHHKEKLSPIPPGKNEVCISPGWVLCYYGQPDIITRTAVADFHDYFKTTWGVEVRKSSITATGDTGNIFAVTLSRERLSDIEKIVNTVSLPPEIQGEAFIVDITAGCVRITAAHSRGLAQGMYYLEKLMSFRGGPVLKIGHEKRLPRFETKISWTVFNDVWDDPEDKLAYSDGYIAKMAHYGINGIFMYINIYNYSSSNILPDLVNTDAEKNIIALKKFVDRCKKYGIDLYLNLNTPPLPEYHPVFKNNPGVRGAESVLIKFAYKTYTLCSSHPAVHDYYAEVINGIIDGCPGLGGLVAIIGGEGFLHCYTRSSPRIEKVITNCQRCAGKFQEDTDAAVVDFINNVTGKLHLQQSNGSTVKFMVWPYSAKMWSQDLYQTKTFNRMNKDIILLTEFEKDEKIQKHGYKKHIWDYSIDFLGPSQRFIAQERLAKEIGRKLYVKTETTVALEVFYVPYNPVMYRWYERIKRIREYNITGVFYCWKFYGFLGSIPEEIAYWYGWNPEPGSIDVLLNKIAVREYGEKAAQYCVKAWKLLSKSFGHHPVIGPYFRGPLYMNAAHPFVLGINDKIPDILYSEFKFWNECIADHKKQPPAAVKTAIHYTLYGQLGNGILADDPNCTVKGKVELFGYQLKQWGDGWKKGVDLLKQAVRVTPNKDKREALLKEYGIAKIIYHSILTTQNLKEFFEARDSVITDLKNPNLSKISGTKQKQVVKKMVAILTRECKHSQEAMELVKHDYRLGYGYTYDTAFTADMIKAKITYTRELIDKLKPFTRFQTSYFNL